MQVAGAALDVHAPGAQSAMDPLPPPGRDPRSSRSSQPGSSPSATTPAAACPTKASRQAGRPAGAAGRGRGKASQKTPSVASPPRPAAGGRVEDPGPETLPVRQQRGRQDGAAAAGQQPAVSDQLPGPTALSRAPPSPPMGFLCAMQIRPASPSQAAVPSPARAGTTPVPPDRHEQAPPGSPLSDQPEPCTVPQPSRSHKPAPATAPAARPQDSGQQPDAEQASPAGCHISRAATATAASGPEGDDAAPKPGAAREPHRSGKKGALASSPASPTSLKAHQPPQSPQRQQQAPPEQQHPHRADGQQQQQPKRGRQPRKACKARPDAAAVPAAGLADLADGSGNEDLGLEDALAQELEGATDAQQPEPEELPGQGMATCAPECIRG